ncbi:hypothetical protein NQ317_016985 [Molorchus minor]|uniref:Uncharacterized protein n=1 Tax=Molorchus minor TaxID=1323400 RepID=A0ABQ9IR79_9CUCU|nr:hypothetical protein NQ317_016985 [Molorchus minor]
MEKKIRDQDRNTRRIRRLANTTPGWVKKFENQSALFYKTNREVEIKVDIYWKLQLRKQMQNSNCTKQTQTNLSRLFCFEMFSVVSTTRTVFIMPSPDDVFIMTCGFFIIESSERNKKQKRKKPRDWMRKSTVCLILLDNLHIATIHTYHCTGVDEFTGHT